jgi:3-(3-hydroxy-phenyl)propionate hydroxylase
VSVLGYELPEFAFRRPPELDGAISGHYPVVVVGAGLAGLTLAAELARRGIEVIVLEQGGSLGVSGIASRGIAYAKRTLEIFDRLDIADRVRAKGQTWNRGSIYDGPDEIYDFEIAPEAGQKWPAFINLQQFYVEEYLVARIGELDGVDLRWRSQVVGAQAGEDGIHLTVRTPAGDYALDARWVAACDGARSSVRRHLGITAPLAQLQDTWAIVDVRADLPGLQRQIWLNSPLIDGGAVVLHPMADGVVRADWQIGHLDDPEAEVTPERVRERLAGFLGADRDFETVSISRWSYRVRVMDQLRHGRALFLGDAAHEIPPFGARGGNGGIQDADNLAWKLEAVLRGHATTALLDTFAAERGQAATENARLSCRAQAFITPDSRPARILRDAVVGLAREHPFARALVNTGRPSTATHYHDTTLALADDGDFEGGPGPGAAGEDGPLEDGFLFDRRPDGFLALHLPGERPSIPAPPRQTVGGFAVEHRVIARTAGTQLLYDRWDAHRGATYVLRPDAHVLGRSREVSAIRATEMVARALTAVDPR